MAPAVSVVLPAYEREDMVGRAVASVLAQTFGDFELIVVDDGSRDGTARVAAAIADPRLRVIAHPANRGAAAARNTAIRTAAGRWIAFLDSDDIWTPDKLERQVAAMNGAPESLRLSCTGFRLHREGRPVEDRIPAAPDGWRLVMLDGCRVSPGSTAMVRRDAFEACGPLDESLGRLEDWDWLLTYTRRFEMMVVPEILADIHVADRYPVTAVDWALARIWERHAPGVRRELGWNAWARFAAAHRMEGAFCRWHSGRTAAALAGVALAVGLRPARVLEVLARGLRRPERPRASR